METQLEEKTEKTQTACIVLGCPEPTWDIIVDYEGEPVHLGSSIDPYAYWKGAKEHPLMTNYRAVSQEDGMEWVITEKPK